MSTPSTTVPSRIAPESTTPIGVLRRRVVALALAAGGAGVVAVLIWEPWPGRNNFAYADLAPVRDAVWAGSLLDAVGIAGLGIGLALAVCLLTPSRGRVLATVAAVCSCLGATLHAGGMISIGSLVWYGTAPGVVPAPVGTALFDNLEQNLSHLIALQAGFLLFTVGVLLAMAALWRAGSIPRWSPILTWVLTLALFSGINGRALDLVQAVQVASIAIVASFVWAGSPTHRGMTGR